LFRVCVFFPFYGFVVLAFSSLLCLFFCLVALPLYPTYELRVANK